MIDRKFGVELEIVGISKELVIRALAAVDIEAHDAGYTHMTTRDWKIVSDASVHGGFELVSPVLEGEEGLETLRTAAQALADAGATANRSCGLHVHIDAHGMTVENIRTIVCRYAAFEEEIDAFMPPSRRGNTNGYCYSVRQVAEDEAFRSARTVAQLAAAQRSRYFKVNLQAFRRHGTIEFRQHSGSVNATKICNWVQLLQDFARQCCQPAPEESVENLPELHGRQGELAALLLQGPVSVSEMQTRWGWQPHTARAAICRLRRAGVAVRFDGERYHLEQAASAGQEDSLWQGVEPDVRRFYQRRAAVLAIRN